MSLQKEFDVQRVVAAVKSEIANAIAKAPNDINKQLVEQHAMELSEFAVQLARVQSELETVKAERDELINKPTTNNPKLLKLKQAAKLRAEAAQLEREAM